MGRCRCDTMVAEGFEKFSDLLTQCFEFSSSFDFQKKKGSPVEGCPFLKRQKAKHPVASSFSFYTRRDVFFDFNIVNKNVCHASVLVVSGDDDAIYVIRPSAGVKLVAEGLKSVGQTRIFEHAKPLKILQSIGNEQSHVVGVAIASRVGNVRNAAFVAKNGNPTSAIPAMRHVFRQVNLQAIFARIGGYLLRKSAFDGLAIVQIGSGATTSCPQTCPSLPVFWLDGRLVNGVAGVGTRSPIIGAGVGVRKNIQPIGSIAQKVAAECTPRLKTSIADKIIATAAASRGGGRLLRLDKCRKRKAEQNQKFEFHNLGKLFVCLMASRRLPPVCFGFRRCSFSRLLFNFLVSKFLEKEWRFGRCFRSRPITAPKNREDVFSNPSQHKPQTKPRTKYSPKPKPRTSCETRPPAICNKVCHAPNQRRCPGTAF